MRCWQTKMLGVKECVAESDCVWAMGTAARMEGTGLGVNPISPSLATGDFGQETYLTESDSLFCNKDDNSTYCTGIL